MEMETAVLSMLQEKQPCVCREMSRFETTPQMKKAAVFILQNGMTGHN